MSFNRRLATYKGFQVLKFYVRVGEVLKILLSKKKEEQFLCFRTKTTHIEQLLGEPHTGVFNRDFVIDGLAKIDFFSSRNGIYSVEVLPKQNMSSLQSCPFTL